MEFLQMQHENKLQFYRASADAAAHGFLYLLALSTIMDVPLLQIYGEDVVWSGDFTHDKPITKTKVATVLRSGWRHVRKIGASFVET